METRFDTVANANVGNGHWNRTFQMKSQGCLNRAYTKQISN